MIERINVSDEYVRTCPDVRYKVMLKRSMQLMLAVDEVRFYAGLIPFGVRLYHSYYYRHKARMVKDIDYTEGERKSERNFLDVYPVESERKSPVCVFVHGGAWGYSSKMDHHMVGRSLQYFGYCTVMPNYSIHPYGDVEDMIDDLDLVMEWVYNHIEEYGGDIDQVMVMGHSAGAHLLSMLLFEKLASKNALTFYNRRDPRITNWPTDFIKILHLCAGVYDIVEHYDYEHWRGVEDLSPMGKAMRSYDLYAQYSPNIILESMKANTNPLLKEQLKKIKNSLKQITTTILIKHGLNDTTVPHSSSFYFFKQLKNLSPNVEFTLNEFDHIGWTFGLMRKPPHIEEITETMLNLKRTLATKKPTPKL